MEMNYCMHCGHKLEDKYLKDEGMIPYCPACREFRFPVFNTAVSMIVTNRERDRILLIKQHGKDYYLLVSGYVNKGEDAENAVRREVLEEVGLDVQEYRFNVSNYYAPSNTLMLNFEAAADSVDVRPNKEVDDWRWFDEKGARENVRPDSLAQRFLEGYFTGVYPWE